LGILFVFEKGLLRQFPRVYFFKRHVESNSAKIFQFNKDQKLLAACYLLSVLDINKRTVAFLFFWSQDRRCFAQL